MTCLCLKQMLMIHYSNISKYNTYCIMVLYRILYVKCQDRGSKRVLYTNKILQPGCSSIMIAPSEGEMIYSDVVGKNMPMFSAIH